MAGKVFGKPITNATLRELREFKDKEITRKDRAMVALEWINAESKSERARMLKSDQWGTGVFTLCLVYNATGDTRSFNDTKHDWGPSLYPKQIANGQWGAFLHVKRNEISNGSEAALESMLEAYFFKELHYLPKGKLHLVDGKCCC